MIKTYFVLFFIDDILIKENENVLFLRFVLDTSKVKIISVISVQKNELSKQSKIDLFYFLNIIKLYFDSKTITCIK